MVNRRSVDFRIQDFCIQDLLAALNQGTRTRAENLRLHPQERRGDRQFRFWADRPSALKKLLPTKAT
ncbi:MAG: hypothetical protein WBA89_25070 [Microcoleus sp.]|uniref:hypothetical protein n=1 Tax=Microcoleus sp. TaxID=44472 RepID=UPI003C760C2A